MAEADPRQVLDSFDDATLMAVGPRGTGLLKRLHIGSTTEWLASGHGARAPLAVIRSARPTRRVLLCVDGSAHAESAAKTLARLPWVSDARVVVLGVTDGGVDVERGVDDAARLLESRNVTSVDRRLVAAIAQTATFDVRSTILNVIADETPDLVVMGTRGVGSIRRTILGSTASAMLRHAPCSVLIARAPENADDL